MPDRQEIHNLSALRQHFTSCFKETYADRLTSEELCGLIAGLNTPDLGGLLPGKDERIVTRGNHGDVSGCAIWALRAGTAYIWGFYVRKAEQRRGVGRSLLMGVLAVLPPQSRVKVQVLKDSPSAVAFYRHFGFEIEGEALHELAPGRHDVALHMVGMASDLRQVT
ncbi:MAG: GNAT family N-acetyltransferase [Sulfitobacter sp.]